MIIAISGTPGTGKHTLARELSKITGYNILDIGGMLSGKEEVSLRQLNSIFNKAKADNLIVVSHMSHFINSNDINLVIVLRTNPEILEKRLRLRNYSSSKIYDNIMFEAIDGTYIEALKTGKKVLQIDNSGDIRNTVKKAIKIIKGNGKNDEVDFSRNIIKIEKRLNKLTFFNNNGNKKRKSYKNNKR